MIAVPIKEFISGGVIPVDLYVRLSDNKFVQIAKQDTKAQAQQLQHFEEKQVDFLFIQREDYNSYVSANVTIAGIVLTHKDISAGRKADFVAKAACAVMNEIEHLGMTPESFEHARTVTYATIALVESRADLFQVLEALSKISDHALAHAVAVSATSVMIGRSIGWTKPATIEKVALGGLLHDVGLKELPPEILAKPILDYTPEEKLVYDSHPFRSMEILRSVPSVPDDVVSIAYEHHENSVGLGFPRKLRDMKINPLAKAVALADAFVDLTILNPNCVTPKSALEALNYIEVTMGQPFNKETFTALKIIVKKSQNS